MRKLLLLVPRLLSCLVLTLLGACAHVQTTEMARNPVYDTSRFDTDYSSRLPATMETAGKKTILVDPNAHAWGAYAADGHLVRAGIATAGGTLCPPDADPNESTCRTGVGTFHVTSLGNGDCYSKKYPRPNGGGLMPFCMYFNNGEALHGSPDSIVVAENVSHGCVRMRIPDAEWMRYNFAQVGTKVVVLPYED